MELSVNPHCCSICYEKFTDPVVLNCGHTFDKKCIGDTNGCPLCNIPITNTVPNYQLRDLIQSNVFHSNKNYVRLRKGQKVSYIIGNDVNIHRAEVLFDNDEDSLYLKHNGKSFTLKCSDITKIWLEDGIDIPCTIF